MKTLLLAFAICVFVLPFQFVEAKSETRRWEHEGSDIAPDRLVQWGVLANGMGYAVMPHKDPPQRVSLRLYVDAGSLMEEEDQQGLAHFLEHMAFNGTTNFPAGEMVQYFQRLGMAFGADTNAHTSFKETVYKLDLPRVDEKLLRESMQLLRDYADGILFAEEEVEKERGVILSEKLSRDSVDYRTYVEKMKFNLPDSLISQRMPIGIEETISTVPRARFLDYYEKYYRPERMVLVVVGDVEPEAMVKLAEEFFGTLESGEGAAADPDLGAVSSRGTVAHFHPEEDASSSWVTIEVTRQFTKGRDGTGRRAKEIRLGLANQMLTRRLEILMKKEGAPFIWGQASSRDRLNFVTMGMMQMAAKPETWKEALTLGEQELRRAVEHGFTEAELAEAKAKVLQVYERRAQTAPTRKSRDIANKIVDRIGERRIFTSPVDDLPRVSAELETVTRDECLEELRALWGGGDYQVFVSGNIDLEKEEGKKAVMATFEESHAVAVEPPVEEEVKAFAYAEDRPAGEIVSREEVEDLGVTKVEFGNGVRLNLKKTDFQEDTIHLTVRIGGGKLTIPRDKPGLGIFAGSTFREGGLVEHSADELERIFAGKRIGLSFSVEDDAFVLTGETNERDFVSQVQLTAAYMTAPGFREEAEGQFRRGLDATYVDLESTPEGVMKNEVSRFVHSGDERFGYPKKEDLAKRSQEEAREWAVPALSGGYTEIAVVGDFGDGDAVIEAVAKTFGSMPARAKEKPAYKEERMVRFPSGEGDKVFKYESDIPKSMIAVYWKTADMWDIERSRRFHVLAAVMRDRMRIKIREELGEAYSPYARSSTSDTFTDYGYLVAMVESGREKAEKIAGILREIAEEMREKGITEDELGRAKEPLMNMLKEYRRNNSYWLQSVLKSAQEHPQRLDWARSIMEDYGGVTVEDMNELAKEYLGRERALSVLIISEDGGEPG